MPHETTNEVMTGADLLADFTSAGLIVPYLRERDAAGVIGELSRRLGRLDCVPDALSFYQAALNQRLLSSFSAPLGFAVTHARVNGIHRLQFAFGRTATPLLWQPKDLWPVRLIFLLAVPSSESCAYLQLLSRLAGLGQHPAVVKELMDAANAHAILEAFKKIHLSQ